MRNWSTNTTELKKHPKEYAVWKMEQLINFGIGKEKLSRMGLISLWKNLHIDPNKKAYLSFLLWPKAS